MRHNNPETAVNSFYHLAAHDLADLRCQGLACFVARRENPDLWLQATSQSPRVYCLGKCYSAPSSSLDEERPRVEVHTRSPIVLK